MMKSTTMPGNKHKRLSFRKVKNVTEEEFDMILENTRCWSDCPPGWRAPVKELLEQLPIGSRIDQIKEKFGGLRLYIDPPEDFSEENKESFYLWIGHHEDFISKLCQECGMLADKYQHRPGDWIRTLCAAHRQER